MRFGKLPPKTDYRTLLFSSYLRDDIPSPPQSVDLDGRVLKNLEMTEDAIPYLFPMYKNDILGDCTVAGAAHGITIYNGMISETHIPKEENVVRIYFHLTGGVDTGLYLLDVIKYWRGSGIEENKIYAYAKIRHTNHLQVMQAVSMFGGLFAGFQCQEKVMEEFIEGTPWEPGELMNAGHAIYITGYDDDGIECLTWGALQRGTWDWWDKCTDECYALLPIQAKDPDFTPGFDFDKLKRDLYRVSGMY
jgi:hypothetical protein